MVKKHLHRAVTEAGTLTHKKLKNVCESISFIGDTSSTLAHTVLRPSSLRFREMLYYMDTCGSGAVFIVFLICFLMGLILGFQSAVQLSKFGADIFVADLVGLSIVKELGPLMVAMITIGRAGSAFAAEIGAMKVSEEIDAMVTMGFVPNRFLVIPKLIAMLIVMPLLTIVGDLAGILGGMVVGVSYLGLPAQTYFQNTCVAIEPFYLMEGLIKSLFFAVLITGVGCLRGFQSQTDAQGVGRSATSAVVTGILLVIISDSILTVLFTA